MTDIIKYTSDEHEFYPTPKSLAEKMMNCVQWSTCRTILEPSAGKGDIIRQFALHDLSHRFDVDCIEIDPNLRAILKYNFGQRKDDLQHEKHDICDKYGDWREIEHSGRIWKYYDKSRREYCHIMGRDLIRLNEIEDELRYFFENGIHIVHDDFMTYKPFKRYDLIIMNPPFSCGDKHLLKALDIQSDGGKIVCLLNAETLLNPCTPTRRELANKLQDYDAKVKYIENAFVDAERKTGVKVALITVEIPQKTYESDIYEHMKKAEKADEIETEDITDLEVTDIIKSITTRYRVEASAGIELIKEYRAMLPYISNRFVIDEKDLYTHPIMQLDYYGEHCYKGVTINGFLQDLRGKYWSALLSNPKFIGRLTSKLQEKYQKEVDKLCDYDFTEFNIKSLSAEINSQIKRGIEDEIIVMFDRLTEEHSWYPECQKNKYLYDGWKTNQAHKINKKVIIPCYGVFSSYDGRPEVYNAYNTLADIERILNFFDGKMTEEVDMRRTLDYCFRGHITKNIELKYFTATFYKKGTCHLVFNCPKLIERFNIYAGQRKNWLPPCYGKKGYNSMTDEEKAVVDSFQGQEAYAEVLSHADYYLKSPAATAGNMLMIGD